METNARFFEFDAGHRVMDERVKCHNLHGHRFKVEVVFAFDTLAEIGYAIDFKEMKRICGDFIDEFFDHAFLANPADVEIIELCKKSGWKLWYMGLGNEEDYINPTAENIASELLYCFQRFKWDEKHNLKVVRVRLYETPNCYVDCLAPRYGATEDVNDMLDGWRQTKGEFIYDQREVMKCRNLNAKN